MTKSQAQSITGLSVREFPECRYDFLRCQLGKWETVEVKLSAYKKTSAPIFHLLAFGSSWEAATDMLERKTATQQHA